MQQRASDAGNGIAGRARKVSSVEQRKKDKEIRKLQQDLQQERVQFSQRIDKLQKDLNDAQALLTEESNIRTSLQMELDSKDAENEQLRSRLKMINFDTVSQNSGSGGFDDEENGKFFSLQFSCQTLFLIHFSVHNFLHFHYIPVSRCIIIFHFHWNDDCILYWRILTV